MGWIYVLFFVLFFLWGVEFTTWTNWKKKKKAWENFVSTLLKDQNKFVVAISSCWKTSYCFSVTIHVIFQRTVPARGCVRGLFMYFPIIVHVSVHICCAGNCFLVLLTHVYCHHQEVALLNSSTELNFCLQAKISSWEQQQKTQLHFNIQELCLFPMAWHT